MNYQNRMRVYLGIFIALIVPLSLTGLLYPYPRPYGSDAWPPRTSKIVITSAVCEKQDCIQTGKYWKIMVTIINGEEKVAKISHARIFDEPVSYYNMSIPVEAQAVTNISDTCLIDPGETRNIVFYIDGDYSNFTSGEIIQIKVRSSSCLDYIKLVELA